MKIITVCIFVAALAWGAFFIPLKQSWADEEPYATYAYFKSAAEKGDFGSQLSLCAYLESVPHAASRATGADDLKSAADCWRRYAAQGNPIAQTRLGTLLTEERDYDQAIKWFTKAAERNAAGAQSEMGRLYRDGLGVPQSYEEAIKWYRKAAEQGDWEAYASVGQLYNQGKGVPQNYEEAAFWYGLVLKNYESGESFRPSGGPTDSEKNARDTYKSAVEKLTPEQSATVRKRVENWTPTPTFIQDSKPAAK
jgi:tetratricopeptide (TPR) repeat protein